ncbi:MAG: sulfurtransferase complex subunit TusD [Pseudomonadales bacterium]
MRLALAVHGAPYASQSSASALRFARAAVAGGHEIPRVFFYHDGVQAASAIAVAPQDEPSPLDGWVALAAEHDMELAVCIAASLKRGVVNEEERARYSLSAANVHPSFAVVGLGQLIDAVMQADRLVTFAA